MVTTHVAEPGPSTPGAFSFPAADALDDLGGPAARFDANAAAIALLAAIERDRRPATPAEQARLARYSAFGDRAVLDRAFRIEDGTVAAAPELAAVLSETDQELVRQASLTAFYTPLAVVDWLWTLARRLGVDRLPRLAVLEPAVGTGAFFSRMPADLRAGARLMGMDIDPVAVRIARLLHPDATLLQGGFESVPHPTDAFDLVMTNLPFGDIPVFLRWASPYEDYLGRTIHDAGLATVVRALRPGGVALVLTSYGTLDKLDGRARRWVARRADLLGAVRLPAGAFGAVGTDAGADLLILRRRHAVIAEFAEADRPIWVESRPLPLVMRRPAVHTLSLPVSGWFQRHPQLVVGRLEAAVGPFGPRVAVAFGGDLPAALAATVGSVPAGVVTPPEPSTACDRPLPTAMTALDAVRQSVALTAARPADQPRLAALVGLWQAVRHLLALETAGADDAAIATARAALNHTYDRLVWSYGYLNGAANRWVIRAEPALALLVALEVNVRTVGKAVVAAKAAIFRRTTVQMPRRLTGPLPPREALLVCLDERNRVDLGRIADLAGLTEAQVTDALDGQIVELPDGRWETAEVYLSGDVRRKLREAEACALVDPRFARQVAALRRVVPRDLEPVEILPSLGASWIPVDEVMAFIATLFPDFARVGGVDYLAAVGEWTLANTYAITNHPEATTTWGTARTPADVLLDATLNARLVKVYDEKPHPHEKNRLIRVLNEAETLAANDKQEALKRRFAAWCWEEPARAARLAARYNERFRSWAHRAYDGAYLSFPGLVTGELRAGDLDAHQRAAVAMIVGQPTQGMAHVVGAGKTLTTLAAVATLRRLGLTARALVIVPKHLVGQWAAEARRFFPHLAVLAMEPDDFTRQRRPTFLSRIVTEDWDLIVMAHSSFKFIPVRPATVTASLQRELSLCREALLAQRQAPASGGATLKRLERAVARQEQRLAELLEAIPRDDDLGITWEDLVAAGVRFLAVDEAQHFKNLQVYTAQGSVAGIPTGNSQRALDLKMKLDYLLCQGGRGVFATATPIMNTLGEAYIMLRYLAEARLAELGLVTFDAWRQVFAQAVAIYELKPDGSGFRWNTRLARFQNVPELASLLREVFHVVGADEVNLLRPELITGRMQVVAVDGSDRLTAIVQDLARRAEAIRSRAVTPEQDNMLVITSEGRLAALDTRLVRPGPEEPGGKLDALVAQVAAIYHASHRRTPREDGRPDRWTQLIFCDIATPRGVDPAAVAVVADAGAANDSESPAPVETAVEQSLWGRVYHEIRRKLVAAGLPAAEVAFIHEATTPAKRDALYAAMNAGTVRVLIGSTAKLGAGVNVQQRLYALHHLDAPWRPGDVEQRNGRILRQGNGHPAVHIFQYVTRGSFDAYIWQILETKAAFIDQLMAGKIGERTVEDVGDVVLSAAEIKAIATGNPRVIRFVELEAHKSRLERRRARWAADQVAMRRSLAGLPERLARAAGSAAFFAEACAVRDRSAGQPFRASLGGSVAAPQVLTDREQAGALLHALVERVKGEAEQRDAALEVEIGQYRGFLLVVTARPGWGGYQANASVAFRSATGRLAAVAAEAVGYSTLAGVFASVEAKLRGLETARDRERAETASLRQQAASLARQFAQPWDGVAEYERVLREYAAVKAALAETGVEVTAHVEAVTSVDAGPPLDDQLRGLLDAMAAPLVDADQPGVVAAVAAAVAASAEAPDMGEPVGAGEETDAAVVAASGADLSIQRRPGLMLAGAVVTPPAATESPMGEDEVAPVTPDGGSSQRPRWDQVTPTLSPAPRRRRRGTPDRQQGQLTLL
ncbi:MAG: methyltransferase domain-containing protein [Chloroflexi bacterium]|nr:methyltransferase domain-containing protein [Chloroflexota bacterium]